MASKEEKLIAKEEKKIEKIEKEIEKQEEKIEKLVKSDVIENKHIYEKLLQIEHLIKGGKGGAIKKEKFTNVDEWRGYIWQTCKFKKQKESKYTIDYNCAKTKKECHFTICPLNR